MESTSSERPSAGYRGQIGRTAAIPRALPNNHIFQDGDVLDKAAGCPLLSRNLELERTLLVGRPPDEQRRMFEPITTLQETALDALRPGLVFTMKPSLDAPRSPSSPLESKTSCTPRGGTGDRG